MTDTREDLKRNLAEVRTRLERAAERSGRTAADVTLVAVTKTLPSETVRFANEIGVRDFGENYANELSEKRSVAPGATPMVNRADPPVSLSQVSEKSSVSPPA